METQDTAVDLSAAMRTVARRWWAVVVVALLGLGASAAAWALQTRTYVSTSSVLVAEAVDASSPSTGQRSQLNLDTEAQIVQSARLASVVAQTLGTDRTLYDLRESVTVTVPPNSQVLTIAFEAPTPTGAQEGARAYVDSYLAQRRAAAEADAQAQATTLQSQIDALRSQLADSRAATDPVASAERDIIVDQIVTLSGRLAAVGATSTDPGTVLTDATLPRVPVAPVLAFYLAGGAFLGLVAGVLLALAADRWSHRVGRPSDVLRKADLPVLGVLDEAAHAQDLSPTTAFDLVRAQTLDTSGALTVVQVQAAGGAVAAERAAVGLWRSIARSSGRCVLVVATDGEELKSSWAPDTAGLSDVLRGDENLGTALLESTDDPRLLLLPPGRSPASLEDLVQSSAFSEVVEHLRRRRDRVVLLTGSADRSPAAQAVSSRADVVVLSVEEGATDVRRLVSARDASRRMGAHVAGAVVSRGRAPQWSAALRGELVRHDQPSARR
ncbi:Wzz/FepE/Etk N-terminal domain-containing protein [Pseudokineococcus marinus]|uniref:Polysaccharide chain length determinant N-terminal domain-containing protein n=1 Tax=Pseudokineococcus marinus TaxID=351215 RepID=A0A849BF40_9ACTN|nr:Wzz/FepE/Etk N-terminal domain-containing protein [Pseudokineococcus marinus]NNH21679.1 hypothetical protein [Pseudokineococcus marinus]